MIDRILAPGAPEPRGPYSHAVRAGDFIYVSGQVAINPRTNQIERGEVASETRMTIENIRAILKAAGADLSDVIKCSVFLADIRDFAAMNEVYGEYFGAAKPARTTVQATLPAQGIKVEIDCVAYKPARE
jgi:2-iminobutanoate/2-iminopropanoate deaminase